MIFTVLVPSEQIGPEFASIQCVGIHAEFAAFRIFKVEFDVVVSSQGCHGSGALGAVAECDNPSKRSKPVLSVATEEASVSEEVIGE
jgi:hypothetical protein